MFIVSGRANTLRIQETLFCRQEAEEWHGRKKKHPFNSTNNPTVGSVLNQRAAVDHAPLFSPLHSNANMQLSEGKALQKKKKNSLKQTAPLTLEH